MSIAMEEKIKHLEFVQNVITRMNTNSFQLKGWMITIVSALLALYANSENVSYIFVAIAPVIIFWCLDAYYLQQERKFRGLYDDIVLSNVIKFEMSIGKYSYDKKKKESEKYRYINVLFSTTMWLYILLGMALILGGVLLCIDLSSLNIHCCCTTCNC